MDRMLLGLDFGTCYSSAALTINDVPKPIKEPLNHGYSFPSSVFITPQEQILIGQAAENSRQKDPQRYRGEFKRDLGSADPYKLGNTARLPEELATEMIRKLKTEAEKVTQGLGTNEITQAVLTIPATYQPFKRQLMEQAGLQAGFEQIELLEEPVAAAYYYSRQADVKEDDIILVYDLGGGTFDATLIQKKGAGYQTLGMPRGLSHCGGIDFDRQIYQGLRSECSPQLQEQLAARDGWLARAIVTEACRNLKHQLSEQQEATIHIPMGLSSVESYSLSRAKFEGNIAPLISETIECCDRLVSSVGLEWQQINRILLVGGSCRIPYIQQTIEQKFQRSAFLVDEPELAVCLGAAIKGLEPIEAEKMLENPIGKVVDEFLDAEVVYYFALQWLNPIGLLDSNYSLALEHLSEAIELNPKYAEAFYTRGETRARMGDKKGAETDLYQASQIYFSRQDFVKYQQAIDKIQEFYSSVDPDNNQKQDKTQKSEARDTAKLNTNTSITGFENYLNQRKQYLTAKNYTWEKGTMADFAVEAIAKGKQNIVLPFDAYFIFSAFTELDIANLRRFAHESLDYCQHLRTRNIFSGIVCYSVALVEEADSSLISALRNEPLHKKEGFCREEYVLPIMFSLKDNTLYLSERNSLLNTDPIGFTAIKKYARQILS